MGHQALPPPFPTPWGGGMVEGISYERGRDGFAIPKMGGWVRGMKKVFYYYYYYYYFYVFFITD